MICFSMGHESKMYQNFHAFKIPLQSYQYIHDTFGLPYIKNSTLSDNMNPQYTSASIISEHHQSNNIVNPRCTRDSKI